MAIRQASKSCNRGSNPRSGVAAVVQWTGRRSPKPEIQVRLLSVAYAVERNMVRGLIVDQVKESSSLSDGIKPCTHSVL